MDGVIADTVSNFLAWYERDYGVKYDKSVFIGKSELEALPDKAVRKYVLTPGFFRSVPVMPGAREALLQLSKDFEIYIVSAAMEFPQSLSEKQEWLGEHFEFISWRNIVFCGDKSIIGTDFMIDDHLKNLDSFRGKPILFTAEHNIHANSHERVNDWKQAVTLLNRLKTSN
jgi:5'(3')-deoxyribonucleotidase